MDRLQTYQLRNDVNDFQIVVLNPDKSSNIKVFSVVFVNNKYYAGNKVILDQYLDPDEALLFAKDLYLYLRLSRETIKSSDLHQIVNNLQNLINENYNGIRNVK